MILAAGRGQRLRPITDNIPKPLVKVWGKSLIDYHLHALHAAGVREVVINVSYKAAIIQEAVGNGDRFGVRVHYSQEEVPLETGGGIFQALPLLGSEPFILVNSDIWTDYPFKRLMKPLTSYLAHLVMVNNPIENQKGDFTLEQGMITDSTHRNLTYAGIALIHPKLFLGCQQGAFSLTDVLKEAIKKRHISGEHYCESWFDIGTITKLHAINSHYCFTQQEPRSD